METVQGACARSRSTVKPSQRTGARAVTGLGGVDGHGAPARESVLVHCTGAWLGCCWRKKLSAAWTVQMDRFGQSHHHVRGIGQQIAQRPCRSIRCRSCNSSSAPATLTKRSTVARSDTTSPVNSSSCSCDSTRPYASYRVACADRLTAHRQDSRGPYTRAVLVNRPLVSAVLSLSRAGSYVWQRGCFRRRKPQLTTGIHPDKP
jgi:hypothetical protein